MNMNDNVKPLKVNIRSICQSIDVENRPLHICCNVADFIRDGTIKPEDPNEPGFQYTKDDEPPRLVFVYAMTGDILFDYGGVAEYKFHTPIKEATLKKPDFDLSTSVIQSLKTWVLEAKHPRRNAIENIESFEKIRDRVSEAFHSAPFVIDLVPENLS